METFATYTLAVLAVAATIEPITATTCTWYDYSGRYHILYCYDRACCGSTYDKYCCDVEPIGAILGGVFGAIAFVIFWTVIACLFCACCPIYRYRTRRTIITTTPAPNYGTTVVATPQPNAPYNQQPPPYR